MKASPTLHILVTCDPEIPVPPAGYGGIERIVDMLVRGLVQRGFRVTLCANPASVVPCALVPWKGARSQHWPDIARNTATLTRTVLVKRPDLVHSFSRLAYMGPIMPFRLPKIMSYQREPSVAQVQKAVRLSAKSSLSFTGCSNYITDQISPYANSTTVYNAAPFDRYNVNATIDRDAPLVFLGRIDEIKGVHEAILVAKKAGRRLVIAGNLPEEGKTYFETKVRPYLGSGVEYIGPVNDRQKNALLGNAAALLMPIQWNEPFGIVMAEAMACGTPVIGLGRGAVPEVVEQGITGFSCTSVDEMVASVKKLGTIDRKTVRGWAAKRFSDEAMVDSYLALYAQILERGRLGFEASAPPNKKRG